MVYPNDDNTGLLNFIKIKHPEYFKHEYTKPEFIYTLLSLQEELIKQLPQNNCDIRRVTDIEDFLRCKANRKGLSEDVTIVDSLDKISDMFEDMQKSISTTIAGMNGERRVYDELNMINDIDIEIIPNVSFSSGNYQCEIDYVVITNYGIYCIEVKTPSANMVIDNKGYFIPPKISKPIKNKKNNVVHQCRVQQHMLKQYIGSDKVVKPLVVCGNWDTDIIQEYDSSCLETIGIGELVDRIMADVDKADILYCETEIAFMKKSINEARFELMISNDLDMEELLKEYEFLLKNIIYVKDEGKEEVEEDDMNGDHSQENCSDESEDNNELDKRIIRLALGAIAVAGVAIFAGIASVEKTAKSLFKIF